MSSDQKIGNDMLLSNDQGVALFTLKDLFITAGIALEFLRTVFGISFPGS
jgi:hypothetical protein